MSFFSKPKPVVIKPRSKKVIMNFIGSNNKTFKVQHNNVRDVNTFVERCCKTITHEVYLLDGAMHQYREHDGLILDSLVITYE